MSWCRWTNSEGMEIVMNICTEGTKQWLFDLAYGNLSNEQIVKGFIRHYVLHGYAMDKFKYDIFLHTGLNIAGTIEVWERLDKALRNYIDSEDIKGKDDFRDGEQNAGSAAGQSVEPAK